MFVHEDEATTLIDIGGCPTWLRDEWVDIGQLIGEPHFRFNVEGRYYLLRAIIQAGDDYWIMQGSDPFTCMPHAHRRITPGHAARVLLDCRVELPAALLGLVQGTGKADETPGDLPPVVLGSSSRDGAKVRTPRGYVSKTITPAKFDVVKALLEASPNGLTGTSLVAKSVHTDAVQILRRLKESDPDWEAVIHTPGRGGKRYWIG